MDRVRVRPGLSTLREGYRCGWMCTFLWYGTQLRRGKKASRGWLSSSAEIGRDGRHLPHTWRREEMVTISPVRELNVGKLNQNQGCQSTHH